MDERQLAEWAPSHPEEVAELLRLNRERVRHLERLREIYHETLWFLVLA
jgi:hypothetical protein